MNHKLFAKITFLILGFAITVGTFGYVIIDVLIPLFWRGTAYLQEPIRSIAGLEILTLFVGTLASCYMFAVLLLIFLDENKIKTRS